MKNKTNMLRLSLLIMGVFILFAISCAEEDDNIGQENVPVLSTANVTEITKTTAISGGIITNDGGSTITARGVCWSTNENPTIEDNKTQDSAVAGRFASNVTDLEPNTTYYLRAYATNSVGTGYGIARSFTTQVPWDVTVEVDLSVPDLISNFEIGLTHTQNRWYSGHSVAVKRVKGLLEDGRVRYQNTHIMGWGPGNPNPEPGVYSWGSLDSRMNVIRSMAGVVPVITFCTAPGWMKRSGEDWNMEDRVADEHFEDFAELCRLVALRYPDVEYFQVWNELKGFNRDIIKFTEMYNLIYNAVKEVRPDAKIGGPYINISGLDFGKGYRDNAKYWNDNKSGAEFFTYDAWLEGWPPGGRTEEWMMGRTSIFGDYTKQFREVVDLPQWISEIYPGRNDNREFVAANYASTYYHSLRSGVRMALLWDGGGLGELFSGTGSADGGQPTLQYFVVKAFNNYFGPGTQLYSAKSSSKDVEVMASAKKVMLINKLPKSLLVNLNGKELQLKAYEVLVLDNQ